MRPCRLSIVASGFHLLTWCRGTSNWQWRKVTWKRLHLELIQWVFTSLLTCLLDFQMQALVFTTWWSNTWEDQPVVTLLLYFNNTYILPLPCDVTLDWIELVFSRHEQFNLKFKPKNCQFFNTSVLFLGHVLSAKGISVNPEKVERVKNWPMPKCQDTAILFGLASNTGDASLILLRRNDAFISW